MSFQPCGCLLKGVNKVQEWVEVLGGGRMGRTPASCSFVSTLAKQTKAQDFHIHEVAFVVISCKRNCIFNVQYASRPLPNFHYQEDTVSKECTHSISRTNKHSFCINYHFQLLGKEWQELSGRCSLLPGFIWWKWKYLPVTNWTFPNEDQLSIERTGLGASR